MSKSFCISYNANNKRIKRNIHSRVENCNTPQCWTLKDENDQGLIWLTAKDLCAKDGKGKLLKINRVLFFYEYGEIPEGANIRRRCKTEGCLNPAHQYILGYEPDDDQIYDQISPRKILSRKDARKWYGDDTK